jgi:hypothetical protein
LRIAQKSGTKRTENHIGDQHSRHQRLDIQWQAGIGVCQADRGSIDHDVRSRFDHVFATQMDQPRSDADTFVQQIDQSLPARRRPVDDDDFVGTSHSQLVRDGSRCSASPHDDDFAACGIYQAPQGLKNPLPSVFSPINRWPTRVTQLTVPVISEESLSPSRCWITSTL